jgi:tRNA-uridine 2-sulfurtransferase
LLKKSGHHVEAVLMKNWEDSDEDMHCSFEKDRQDAEIVCDLLNINLEIVNFSDQYWQHVFANFLETYRQGLTPNPDILCNKEIKFKAFLNYAKLRGADYIATGHYVRTFTDKHHLRLLKGRDLNKDQSYFLYALDEFQLSHSLFPIGDLTKHEVREIASSIGLPNHNKKDSTGICFIGERKFKTFLNEYLPSKSGQIKTIEGEVIGEHDGLMFYTLGQRQGLRIGGKKNKEEAAWYVAEKDVKNNMLIVVQGHNHPALFKHNLLAGRLHWINQKPSLPLKVTAKTRYRQPDQPCEINFLDDHHVKVNFEKPQRAITPGQSIVFYQGDICLGGGIIER